MTEVAQSSGGVGEGVACGHGMILRSRWLDYSFTRFSMSAAARFCRYRLTALLGTSVIGVDLSEATDAQIEYLSYDGTGSSD